MKTPKVNLRFLDLYRFMASSLDTLASYLTNEQKVSTKRFCQNEEEFNLLRRKGICPY